MQPRPPLAGLLVAPVKPRPPLPDGLRAFVKPRPPLPSHKRPYEPFAERRGWWEFQFGGSRQKQGRGRFHPRSHAACGGALATLSERRRCGVSPTAVLPAALAALLGLRGGVTVGRHPWERKRRRRHALLLAGDAVVVAIELRSITRLAPIDGSSTGSACFGAVLVVRSPGFSCGCRLPRLGRFLGDWGSRGSSGRGGWSW